MFVLWTILSVIGKCLPQYTRGEYQLADYISKVAHTNFLCIHSYILFLSTHPITSENCSITAGNPEVD